MSSKAFRLFSSLKLAVVVILSLVFALAAGTIVESVYDTPTSQYWVYRSLWFHGVLALLGINILCVALSRLPWKPRHTPFLMAHAGILILLLGSWLTERVGLDGSMRISEGESTAVVDLEENYFVLSQASDAKGGSLQRFQVPWIPPHVTFKGMTILKAQGNTPTDVRPDIVIDQFLTHADPVTSFVPDPSPMPQQKAFLPSGSAAIKLRVVGGPMRISQEIWLWEGSPGWKTVQAGPAQFSFARSELSKKSHPELDQWKGPRFEITVLSDGGLSFQAIASTGGKVSGRFNQDRLKRAKEKSLEILPHWKGDVKLSIEDWIPRAQMLTNYRPARQQYGTQAPPSAIHVSAAGNRVGIWLGLGDRASLHVGNDDMEIGYMPKRIVLPFAVRLNRFAIEHDPGTANPASYSSQVTALEGASQKDHLISMNEPLEHRGYTLYQASYENELPRPVTSILAVNRDPGRFWKYLGSALIVMGSALLFAAKYRTARRAPTQDGLHGAPKVSMVQS